MVLEALEKRKTNVENKKLGERLPKVEAKA